MPIRRSWQPVHPAEAAELFTAVRVPWWIAGGWALELFSGAPIRSHGDLDIGILRHDLDPVRQVLSTWEICEAQGGQLARLDPSRIPRPDVHTLWCRPRERLPWAIELMLDDGDAGTWIYRRRPAHPAPCGPQ